MSKGLCGQDKTRGKKKGLKGGVDRIRIRSDHQYESGIPFGMNPQQQGSERRRCGAWRTLKEGPDCKASLDSMGTRATLFHHLPNLRIPDS